MPVRLSVPVLAFALAIGCILHLSTDTMLVAPAQAQSAQPSPLERARTTVENLINHLRGRDLPDGIVKSNGRLEATEVDIAAKYPGRLISLTVNEGDEVTAGQVVGKISSPETEAQLTGAQAQVLKAKQSLAEAEANIVQRNSDLVFARTDFDRAKRLLASGFTPEQVYDQRRNRFEAAEAAYVAANAQRDQAIPQSRPPKPTSNVFSQFLWIWCSCRPEADACNTGLLARARWLLRVSAFLLFSASMTSTST
jgi:HlyD family secretion protein